MTLFFQILIVLLPVVFCVTEEKTIAVIHSYSENYGQTKVQDKGLLKGLHHNEYFQDVNLNVHRYHMQTRQSLSTEDERLKIAQRIYDTIQKLETPPEVYIIWDDPAFEYFAMRTLTEDDVVVFGGVNGLVEKYSEIYPERLYFYYFIWRGSKMTGVLEDTYFVSSLRLMRLIKMKSTGITILPVSSVVFCIIDKTLTGDGVEDQILDALDKPQFQELEVGVEIHRVEHLQDFAKFLDTANRRDDVSLIYLSVSFIRHSAQDPTIVPINKIHELVRKNSKKLEIANSPTSCEEGYFGGISSNTFEMGEQVGNKVGMVLNGDKADFIPMTRPKPSIFFHEGRAREMGIDISHIQDYADYLFDYPEARPNYTFIFVLVIFLVMVLIIVCMLMLVLLYFAVKFRRKNLFYEDNERIRIAIENQIPGLAKKTFSGTIFEKLRVSRRDFNLLKGGKVLGRLGVSKDNIKVFLAHWKDREVVYKRFGEQYRHQEDYFKQYHQEISALFICKNLGVDNVVDILGFVLEVEIVGQFEECKELGFLMEYCEKGNLWEYIEACKKKRKRINFDEKIRILYEICCGMTILHENNIIHRDIKPQNLLVTKDGTIKITDFDFSKVDFAETKHITSNIGTSFYKSPEIIKGTDYDQKTDVFSFAIVMYQLMTEKMDPYDIARGYVRDGSIPNIDLQIVSDPNYRPKIYGKLARRKWVVKLLRRCWNDKPANRPEFHEIKRQIRDKISERKRRFERTREHFSASGSDDDQSSGSSVSEGIDYDAYSHPNLGERRSSLDSFGRRYSSEGYFTEDDTTSTTSASLSTDSGQSDTVRSSNSESIGESHSDSSTV